MKRTIRTLAAVFLAVTSAFGFVACGADPETPPAASDDPSVETPVVPGDSGDDTPNIPDGSGDDTPSVPENKSALVVYFSWSSAGNTEKMANYISERIDATIWEITPVTLYPTEYTPTTEVAREEKESGARPAIKDPLTQAQINEYDNIFVGFPIWWHTAPMIIGTFLESYEFGANDNIYPFFQGASNSNNSYYSETMEFINACAGGATVRDGLYASQNNTAAIDNYLRNYGFIK